MFGDDTQQAVDNGATMPMMDPGVMADPSTAAVPMAQPVQEHQMTPAYPDVDSTAPTMGMPDENPVSADAMSPEDRDLLAIKQDALNALSPLVGNLEQTPEERFRTTMMLIQASDDRTLVRVAYESAQAIVDEKLRAQALLDVINEINYFTAQA